MTLEIGIKGVTISFLATFAISFAISIILAPFAVFYGLIVYSMTILCVSAGMFLCFVMIIHFNCVNGYPVDVEIAVKRGNSFKIVKDRAKRIALPEAGKFEFKLKNKNMRTKPIEWEYLESGDKGQDYLKLFQLSPTEFRPVKRKDFETLEAASEADKMWYATTIKSLIMRWKFKDNYDKLAIPAMLVTVGVVIMIIIYTFVGQMSNITAQVGGISSQLADTAKSFKEAADRFSGAVESQQPVQGAFPTGTNPASPIPPPPSPIT